VSVRLATNGRDISGVQNDILFDSHTALHECVQAPAASVTGGFHIASLRARALLYRVDGGTMRDEEVLYTCRVAISNDADARNYPLLVENALASDPAGNAITIAAADGQVSVVESAGARQGVGAQVSSGGGGCELTHQRSVGVLWLGIPIGIMVVRRLKMVTGRRWV